MRDEERSEKEPEVAGSVKTGKSDVALLPLRIPHASHVVEEVQCASARICLKSWRKVVRSANKTSELTVWKQFWSSLALRWNSTTREQTVNDCHPSVAFLCLMDMRGVHEQRGLCLHHRSLNQPPPHARFIAMPCPLYHLKDLHPSRPRCL
jgi:hypothetical protein